ncbi:MULTISPECIES: hypothetical protein [unclassified Streptomyces]|uniref:hypothetical protein n=1 Tax=unclassified Streptomyces TaxID=2593676 RepID=UPI0029BC7E0C|nr:MULTISPECIES: hypothetical protein [unclassified Streptomyces]MDX3771234.1 hypothetical protein [Streptomyces sp. AK08-01B]MDX3820727.1 hypothetical protein [Streptomyces sp. AK08-01A]
MTSTNGDRPTWQRKRTQKRKDVRAQRTENHHQQLRRQGAERGFKGVAEAEWNIVRSAIGRLPQEQGDDLWRQMAAILRQIAEKTRRTGDGA